MTVAVVARTAARSEQFSLTSFFFLFDFVLVSYKMNSKVARNDPLKHPPLKAKTAKHSFNNRCKIFKVARNDWKL